MSAYFKYHVGSGHIDTKLVVNEASNLEIHREDGYDFIPVGEDAIFGKSYVTPEGDFGLREQLPTAGAKLVMSTGEHVEIALPDDCWVRFGDGTPMLVDDNVMELTKESEGQIKMELVGRYAGNPWVMRWYELASFKTELYAKIDGKAEELRAALVTEGTGQSITYLRKADAARAYLAGQEISDAQMQRIQDEATRMGMSLEAAAQHIVDTADAWEAHDAEIDKVRLDAKAMIQTSDSGRAANAIYEAIVWPE